MTKKKQRFKRANQLRKLGFPFALARKVANDLVRYGMLMRTDLPGLHMVHHFRDCSCCSFELVVVDSPKGPLEFQGRMDSDFC